MITGDAARHDFSEAARPQQRDKKIWFFNCANTFSGNPKWLFLYVNHFRPDIQAYWICDDPDTANQVKSLGYRAFTFDDPSGHQVQRRAGVFVVNQVKERIPAHMTGVTLLNLWHGVGVKGIERNLPFSHSLLSGVATKYIRNNQYYRDHQLFLVTSPMMEKHFTANVGLDEEVIIRGGYPQNVYPRLHGGFTSFDHDLLAAKGLPANTRIAAWFPTPRASAPQDFIRSAIPNMPRMIEALEQADTMLILKMHPTLEQDPHYLALKETYQHHPRLYFWNPKDDVYEVFPKIDVAIVDYSSITYDLIAAGVTGFLRYIYDYAEGGVIADSELDYLEMTTGRTCESFEELLTALGEPVPVDTAKLEKLTDLFWSYSDDNDLERITEAALAFPGRHIPLKELHSFDVFDTLIHREGIVPRSVFVRVKEEMRASDLGFPSYLVEDYPQLRHDAEIAVRVEKRKRHEQRVSGKLEIQFEEIFTKLGTLFQLSEAQLAALKKWELDTELEAVVPDAQNIALLKEQIAAGHRVILISDMYLPKAQVTEMLSKADPVLAEVPLYLSSELGVQKTTGKLFLYAYLDLHYDYSRWIHHGDNVRADVRQPRRLAIKPELVPELDLTPMESALINDIGSYDSYLLAGLMRNMRLEKGRGNSTWRYAWNHVTAYLVPYVDWVLDDAVKRGYRTLYFVSRDGYHLKRIADALIEARGLALTTRYLYGSRISWRIPSQVDVLDADIFLPHGDFANISSTKHLLTFTRLSREEFLQRFPDLSHILAADVISTPNRALVAQTLGASEWFRQHLLESARAEREMLLRYLKQNVDLGEPFAIVEYWGRGYTQDCLTRLLEELAGEPIDDPFYYARSIYPTEGRSIRHNFTSSGYSMLFIEAIFANLDRGTVLGFRDNNGVIEPVTEPRKNNSELHAALSEALPEFARRFAATPFRDLDRIRREYFRFGFDFYRQHPDHKVFVEVLAPLADAVELGSPEHEFAPALTPQDLKHLAAGDPSFLRLTRSVPLSLARSTPHARAQFEALTRVTPEGQWRLRRRPQPKRTAASVLRQRLIRILRSATPKS